MLQSMGSQRVRHNLVTGQQKPLVRTLYFELPRAKFQSLVEKLRSCKLCDAIQKKKKKTESEAIESYVNSEFSIHSPNMDSVTHSHTSKFLLNQLI